ncbi:MAG: ATP-binding protein [Candidatus Omnitrophota bacterium]|nr:ATP-binding protein [Candidatus Omnitrophota bacterium]
MKLIVKLTLSSLAIALMVVIIGFIFARESQKILKRFVIDNSVLLADEILNNIDRSIYDRIEEFQIDSNDLELQKAVKESNEEFMKIGDIQDYIDEKNREWISVPKKEITPFMQGLIDNKLSEQLRRKTDSYEKEYGYQIIPEVFITNRYGANIAQTQKTSGYYQGDEKWWQEAKRFGLYVGDVEYDESAGIYSLAFGINIIDENNNSLGIMKVVLNIKETIDILKQVGQYTASGGKACVPINLSLVTKERRIIYTIGEHKVFQDVYEKIDHSLIKGRKPYFIQQTGLSAQEEEKLIIYTQSRGFKDYKGMGWILIIEYKINEVFASAIKLKNTILIMSLCLLTFSIVIGLFIVCSILRPIMKLIDAVVEIGKGKLDTKVDISSSDEIGQLAKTFNQMVIQLKTAQEEIIRSEKLAVLGKLAGIVSHELRNPLAGIRNVAYFLRMKLQGALADEKIKRHLDILEEEVNISDRIIDNILVFNRKKEPSLSKADIQDIIKGVIEKINVPENIEVIIEAKQDRIEILVDEIQIRQVFSNIILNAIQAMPDGGKLIVGIQRTDEQSLRFVDICIKDTGEGIEPENLHKIFEPLFSTKAKGTGLGLAICQSIIKGHNGLISVESQPEKGASFIIRLPAPVL